MCRAKSRPWKSQSMESLESHEAGFPPFPHSLEIPSGFPHSHGLDDWIYIFSCPLNPIPHYRKGLVTDVSGPQRNACPGTLTPLSGFCCCSCFRFSTHQGRHCGQERGCYETLKSVRCSNFSMILKRSRFRVLILLPLLRCPYAQAIENLRVAHGVVDDVRNNTFLRTSRVTARPNNANPDG